MIIDKLLEFSTAQTLTESAASENYVDTLAAGSAYGNELWLVVRVGTKLESSGDPKLTISLQSDSDSNFSTALKTHASSGEITKTSCTDNTVIWKTRIPPELQRYLRLYYTVENGSFSGGTIDAFITPDIPIGF